ncbi:unnamed protein product [Adineta steineri]|uniref:Uncharacterized protein n=1 Tax=Adineta steineri TaxID=433720 RepID=A0A814WP69_9BILA|nr:unnamed protein product [Adineta steineri]CAF3590056.1 unnamed protein product [Adineta steineri]
MSVIKQLSCTVQDDTCYTNFLNALNEINDETIRNRCHKYWTTLYQYFDRSKTNEHILIVEEKRIRELLHRSKTQNILQRGHEILSDLHSKYNTSKQNINNLQTEIQKHKLHNNIKTICNIEIKDLQKTREILRLKLNINITEKELSEIQHELKKEQKLSSELKIQNKQLNNLLFQNKKNLQMNENDKNILELIDAKQEQIEKEKAIKQDISQMLRKFQIELKRKKNILFIQNQQKEKLKSQLIHIEYQHNKWNQQSTINISDNITQSTNNFKKELQHRLQLSILHNNVKQEHNILDNTTKQYAVLVKEQRKKIINYEKFHDKWIIEINQKRKRLLELIDRLEKLDKYIINTNTFFQDFNSLKLSSISNTLIFQNEIDVYLQQRKENNNSIHMNLIDENQMKKILHSNQIIFHQIKQDILFLDKNNSLLLNQITTINKQKNHLTAYIDSFHTEQQQILNIQKKFDYIKHSIDLNNQNYQRFTQEKEKIILCLLTKQHLIILITEYIEENEKKLNKYKLCYNQLLNNIQQVRNTVLYETRHKKPLKKYNQLIIYLQKDLFKYKKKTKDLQYRIYQRTKISSHHKSVQKELNNQSYHIDFEQKLSLIIYQLICKTHYNIILHKRLDVLIEHIFLLYNIDEKQSLKKSYLFYVNNNFKTTNQIKSSLAELRILKNEILIYEQIYVNIKIFIKKTTGTEL